MRPIPLTLSILALSLSPFAGATQAQNIVTETTTDEPNLAALPALGGPTHAAPARELILRAGYEDVNDLKREDDGLWHARAKREGALVDVKIAADGTVLVK